MPDTRALLLTDIVDSTRLSAKHDAAHVAGTWAMHDRVARDLLAAHGGREIDKTDRFRLMFERASDAAAYAVAYHAAIARLDPPLRARAGPAAPSSRIPRRLAPRRRRRDIRLGAACRWV